MDTARTARANTLARATASRMPLYGTLTGLLIASVAAVGIGANLDSPRSLMTRHDYAEGKRVVEAQWRLALAQCRELEGTRKSQCRTLARADDQVRKAELELRYLGTVNAESDARAARARREALAYLKL